MTETIPNGFTPWPPSSPFMEHLGQMYRSEREDGSIVLALRLGVTHTNMHDIAHGGMLATLADNALGHVVALKANTSVVTVQMSLDFMSAVKPGDWLEAHVMVDKIGRRLIYATCRLMVGERSMLKASGVFAVVQNKLGSAKADG